MVAVWDEAYIEYVRDGYVTLYTITQLKTTEEIMTVSSQKNLGALSADSTTSP